MNSENNFCPICIESFKNPVISKCGHSFCESCILQSLSNSDKCPICQAGVDSDSIFPNLALQSLQKEIELKDKHDVEELKRLNRQKISIQPRPAVITEFFTLLEEKKTIQLSKVTAELEKIRTLKEKLGIQSPENSNVLGSKRKAPTDLDEKDAAKIEKLRDRFDALSDAFTANSDWDSFSKNISIYTQSYHFKEIASFHNSNALSTGSKIISSIESDRYGSHFATAGVLKRINIYNLTGILNSENEMISNQYPILNIECNSKISSLSWNPFFESKLCSADYDGILNMYDISTGKKSTSWTEHEKRCWSVDTSVLDPQKILSGSDDFKVKLWSQKNPKSLLSIDIRANVCSVRFSPKDSNLIAVGGSDHRVLLFDLRKPSEPIFNQKEHSKSVSYVKFTNSGSSFVSASTDSTLRLWSPNKSTWDTERIMSGHLNEKNFVGLSVINDRLIATGSEDNTVVIYDQNLESPVLKYSITTTCPLTGNPMDDELGTFVSSVSWANRPDKDGNSVLLTANSTGNIKILSIIEE